LEVASAAGEAAVQLQALWTATLLDGGESEKLIAALQAAYPKARGAALVAAGSEAIHKQELESWFPAEVKSAAVVTAPVITKVNADRQKVVARYVKAGAERVGEAKRGQAVYQRACMACHQWADMGIELGPNLATVATKPPEQIVEAIFDPNRAVEQRNAATQVMKKDGSIVLGLIVAETPNHLTLRAVGGLEVVVPRADIKGTELLPISLMPEGLESVLTEQDCADLLALIRGR
jgi:putative heme-binding domain-containing protein